VRDGPPQSLLFGFAPGGVYPAFCVTAEAVSSYLAFSPLPAETGGSFLWHFPEVTFSGRYPAPCPAVFGLSSLA